MPAYHRGNTREHERQRLAIFAAQLEHLIESAARTKSLLEKLDLVLK